MRWPIFGFKKGMGWYYFELEEVSENVLLQGKTLIKHIRKRPSSVPGIGRPLTANQAVALL